LIYSEDFFMAKRMQTRRTHHRQRRQDAELRDQELRSHAPESSRAARKKRAPFWKVARFLALILLLAGSIELVVAALTSPRFQVAEVTTSGAQITPQEDLAAIQKTLVGQNWVRAKTSAAQKKLLAIPTIKNARIVRALHWPPSLHIRLEERTPFARVGAGSEWWMVDESGVPFRRAQKSDDDLYALTGPKLQPQLGVPLPTNQWQNCARLVRALDATGSTPGSKWNLRRVYFDKNGFAALRVQGGSQDELLIRLGGDRWEKKLEQAQMALAFFERSGKRAQSLNLVSYHVPQWTPLQPAESRSTPDSDNGSRAGA
jgi:cell division protein FtsQ